MRIQSDSAKDTRTLKLQEGGYEWWYFDGIDSAGETVVTIIFFEGNPFSSQYRKALKAAERTSSAHTKGSRERLAGGYPAISICIYRHGRPYYYGFQEYEPEKVRFSQGRTLVQLERNEIQLLRQGKMLTFRIVLDQKLPNGDSVTGELIFSAPEAPSDRIRRSAKARAISGKPVPGLRSGQAEPASEEAAAGKPADQHIWNLVQPRADLHGELRVSGFRNEKILLQGQGYHDHNTGLEPLENRFSDWYWGRFHFERDTLVYYMMQTKAGPDFHTWLIGERGEVVTLEGRHTLQDREMNRFGLFSSRKISLEGESAEGRKVRYLIQQDHLLDNGPFYQRFLSQALLESDHELQQASGITEYLQPGRIGNRLFRPLTDMRIIYPGRTHWVQRSPRLYRWTW